MKQRSKPRPQTVMLSNQKPVFGVPYVDLVFAEDKS